ncbi:hypothetical protein PsYK624_001400 [Phanerochaete sordida]|uniref:Uncharacterized protein n=1 Tax=Phanerochaete sordida TaxID=48140 RepID=A0A9P3FXA4_9APHY|nr:hypothetical protein PsYK624_001400 [Phanerochaete sordida]
MHAGSLFRKYYGSDFEFLLLYLFLLGIISIPLTSIAIAAILRRGQHTQFPPSQPHVGFVAGPDYRGTVNVIWVCMSTIFTCVYLSVHIDVPDKWKAKQFSQVLEAKDPPKTVAAKILRACLAPLWHFTARPICRRMFWMLFNIFAPELVVLVAVTERRSAKDALTFMRSRGQDDWTMQLAFFADMGGFELDDGTPFRDGLSFLQWFDKLQGEHEEGVKLDIAPLLDEINDRCNADLVLKVLTCSQAAWLVIETIVRFAEAKAVSELEITTCAYIICTLVAYMCWLEKPYSVGGRVTIRDKYILPSSESDEDSLSSQETPPMTLNRSYSTLASESTPSLLPLAHLGSSMLKPRKSERRQTHLPIKLFPGSRFTPFNRSLLRPDSSWPVGCHAAGVLGAIVGLIHGIPFWNALFFTTTGQWLWRASCIGQVVVPVAIAAIAIIERWYYGVFLYIAMFLMAFLYCVFRMILFALIWISFWSLPESVYRDIDWSWAYFPHWH